MNPATMTIIRQEHAALSALLRSLRRMIVHHREEGSLPDFAAMRAMLFYIDEFPEKRHHPKETHLLFVKLRARVPLARRLIDRLDNDHARGELRVRDLEHALLAFEMLGERRRQAFEQMAELYVDFYLDHMAVEETELLPMAARALTDEDWQELDLAFQQDGDLLANHGREAEYEALFARIVQLVPPPFGVQVRGGRSGGMDAGASPTCA